MLLQPPDPMEEMINEYLPHVLMSLLFFVVVGAVLKALLRPLGKVALGVGLLVLLGVLPLPVVQEMLVDLFAFFFETAEMAFQRVVLGG